VSYFNDVRSLFKSATVPLIVVYTKFDAFVNQLAMALMASHPGELNEESIMKQTRSKAESSVREGHNKITQLTGESVPYAFVSSKLVEMLFRFVPHVETNLDS